MNDQLPLDLAGLPTLPDAAPGERLSADQRRTLRYARNLAAGRHPFGVALLTDPPGETCGSCCHAFLVQHTSRRYWKCQVTKGDTSSASSDLRLKWPACERWGAKP